MRRTIAAGVALVLLGAAAEQERPGKDWEVRGRVTDTHGRGVEGARVWAACGMGSLRPTGETTRAKDGTYVLRFGPGIWVQRGEGTRGAGLQAATISVSKEGWYETNLGRQGNLGMTDEAGGAGDGRGYQGVVRKGEVYGLSFELAPAATVEGRVVDAAGKPVKQVKVWLTGRELPPSCSVLMDGETDDRGAFTFNNVPVGYEWVLEFPEKLKGAPFKAKSAETVRLELVRDVEHGVVATKRVAG